MAVEDFPAQCQDTCPWTGVNLIKNHIVTTKNCEGPNFDPCVITEEVDLTSEGGPYASPTLRSARGRVACRNAGINLSIEAQLNE